MNEIAKAVRAGAEITIRYDKTRECVNVTACKEYGTIETDTDALDDYSVFRGLARVAERFLYYERIPSTADGSEGVRG